MVKVVWLQILKIDLDYLLGKISLTIHKPSNLSWSIGNGNNFFYLWIPIPNVSLNLPKIWEGPNTYSPFFKLVETEYWETNRYFNYTKFKPIFAYRWIIEIKLFVNSISICNFSVSIVFYCIYLQKHCLNVTQ